MLTSNSHARISFDMALDAIADQMTAQFTLKRKIAPTPVILSGLGIGKSQTVQSLADDVSLRIATPIYTQGFNLMNVNYLDLSGAAVVTNLNPDPDAPPHLQQPTLTQSRPTDMVLPSLAKLARRKHTLIIVDEIDKGPEENRHVIAGLLQDNKLGSLPLPYGEFFVVALGNDQSVRSGGSEISPLLINRTNMMCVTPSTRRWLADYSLRPSSAINPIARSFVEQNPGGMFTKDAVIPDAPNTPFLTLRSFTQAVSGLPYLLPLQIDPKRIDPLDTALFARMLSPDMRPRAEAMLAGMMGAEAAHQYLTHALHHSVLPTRKEVEQNPATAKLPTYATDPSALHTAASCVLAWASTPDNTRAQLESYTAYASRFDATVRTSTMLKLDKMDKRVSMTKAFTKFAMENQTLVAAVLER